jgi:hypothetical protein
LGVKQKEALKKLGWTVELAEYQSLLEAGRLKDVTATERRVALYRSLKDKLDGGVEKTVESSIIDAAEATFDEVVAMRPLLEELHTLIVKGQLVGDVRGQTKLAHIRTLKAIQTSMAVAARDEAKEDGLTTAHRRTEIFEELASRQQITVDELAGNAELVATLKQFKVKGRVTTAASSCGGAV